MSIEAAPIMSQNETGSPRKRHASKVGAKPAKNGVAFDLWLDRGLHTLFDGVASEPVPEEFLRMIEEDRGK